ncbi:MAG: FAD binding domain-containing protein [Deltaproteobacteria bacterium]|nr:FAD binding domain-containing protein [Deltaproteobacteria bacterium]
MNDFAYARARTWDEALSLYEPGAVYVAGGTDLLPNVKHRLVKPARVVAIGGIPGGIDLATELVIGATTPLQQVADSPVVRALVPPLAQAAQLVAGPQIRAMGTLGGNVLLDTRCLYYNQTEGWRTALGYCLKAEGTWCHVVGGPKTCVAAQSSDTVPVLLALGARLRLLGPSGRRELPIRDLYRFNGMDHLAIEKGELLTEIVVPRPPVAFRGSYQKLRTRDSIDFPQLGLAIAAELHGDTIGALEMVVGAANPQPKPVRGLEALVGQPLSPASIEAIADLVYKQTRPQGSVHGSEAWRRQMARVMARRGLEALGR